MSLVAAAITLWSTVYLEWSIAALRQQREIDESLLHISRPGWNHINLTGDSTLSFILITVVSASHTLSVTPISDSLLP